MPSTDPPPSHDLGKDARGRLQCAIEHAAHYLPAQGPINVFIHHNTLHAFEHLTFDDAVRQGARVFGCEPYLSEERYRTELSRGRIRFDDLSDVLHEDLGPRANDSLVGLATRLQLRLAMLEHSVWSGPIAELLWYVAEADVLRRVRQGVSVAARGRLLTETRHWVMRDLRYGRKGSPPWSYDLLGRFGVARVESWDEASWEAYALEALWHVCRAGVGTLPPPSRPTPAASRHRDLLREATEVDTDRLVNEVLIRFCAAFLDQGMSHWSLPGRDRGLYRSFLTLHRHRGGPAAPWLRDLPAEAARLLIDQVDPLDSIAESLDALGVEEGEWDDFLAGTLLALRGWAGMVHQVEQRGDRVPLPAPAGSLVEFVAVRLLLDRLALAHVSRMELAYTGPLASLRAELHARAVANLPVVEQRAFPVFKIAQVLGWSPLELHGLTPGEWALLVGEVEGFSKVERRRVFHMAYERRFSTQVLDALSLHPRYVPAQPSRPAFQVVTCLDEREESFRRHLEESAPEGETFGAAGFYGVAMYYRGASDAHFVPLCPIVIRPRHWVEEQVTEGDPSAHEQRTRARRALGALSHRFHLGTRGFATGALLTACLGVLATVPLVVRVLFPSLAAAARRWFGGFVQANGKTRLNLERVRPETGSDVEGQGYTVAEMTDIAERQLRDIGLTKTFAPLVLVLGHGSHSMNNPHESAHDCGACGGAVGGPNGRAIAQMLNDPRVREGLARRGLQVPADTVFVGGLHNTCNEYVKFADVDRIPESHRARFAEAREAVEEALGRNAHERARRFDSAPLTLSFEGARQHVDNRAEDLAQVRPEWGHATNAACIVGRRERTRGLYLDRRPFLVSYDPTQDDADATILARILGAAVPVCAGIALEYYFGHVDPVGYGCGTKLPHNVTSMLGVMDGAASDLRTGLPWQMVEIHEPLRLSFVIETTPVTMQSVLARHEEIAAVFRNGWVHLAVLDPASEQIQVYRGGEFRPYSPRATHLPRADSSLDWYRGWRDHLEFAAIGP